MLKFKLIFFLIFFVMKSSLVFSETIRYISINDIMNQSKAGLDIISQLKKKIKYFLLVLKIKKLNLKKMKP